MRARAVLAALAGASIAAGCAGEPGQQPPNGLPAMNVQQRGMVAQQALRLVTGRPSDFGYRLVLGPSRHGVRAVTDRSRRTITLFMRTGEVPHLIAHDLAHEMGHAYDDRRMTDAGRRAYLRRRGAAGSPWWPGRRFSDYKTGAGDFAEVFALCHAASPQFRSRLAGRPSNPCALLPQAARPGTMEAGR